MTGESYPIRILDSSENIKDKEKKDPIDLPSLLG